MRKTTRFLFGSLLVVAASFFAPTASAFVTTVAPSPTATGVALGQASPVTIVWNVTRVNDGNGFCGGPTVSSTSGELRGNNGNGPLIATIPTVLTQTQPCPMGPGLQTQFVFTETLFLPADIVQRAQRQGFGALAYIRSFNDGAGPSGAEMTLIIVTSAATSLAVQRLALSFDNGAPARVLASGEPLGATAEVTFSGTGLLQAQWEIAGPESTAGTPAFRVLSQVRQYVAAGDTRTFRSPPLPTNASGLHFVRLRITDPQPAFEAPTIRYFVLQGAAARDAPGRALAIGGPPPRALLAPDTAFTWEAVRGARAYQLEIYDTGESAGLGLPDLDSAAGEPRQSEVAQALSRPAVTGMLVSGTQPRTSLSPAVRQHLLPGRRYLWRVLALGPEGRVIGVSPMRELRTP